MAHSEHKKVDRPDWDQYFLGIALIASGRSQDAETNVGALIVKDNRILSMGYNGLPIDVIDENLPNTRPDKYPFFLHAEMNAILLCEVRPEGATLYCPMKPCNVCLMSAHQSGIKRIVYGERLTSTTNDPDRQKIHDMFMENCKNPMELVQKDINLDWLKRIINA